MFISRHIFEDYRSSQPLDRPIAVTSVDHLVFAGNASGPPPAISARELARRGSLPFHGPLLFNYVVTREELTSAAHVVFAAVKSKRVCVVIRQKYLLAEAATAQPRGPAHDRRDCAPALKRAATAPQRLQCRAFCSVTVIESPSAARSALQLSMLSSVRSTASSPPFNARSRAPSTVLNDCRSGALQKLSPTLA